MRVQIAQKCAGVNERRKLCTGGLRRTSVRSLPTELSERWPTFCRLVLAQCSSPRSDTSQGRHNRRRRRQTIDALFVDDDKFTVFVIQGKFLASQSVDAGPLREVLSAWLQMRDLVRLQEVANQKLKRKLSEVARALEDEYEVSFELLTTGVLTEGAQNDLATFQQQLAGLSEKDDFPATIRVIDQDEIRRRYDLALDKENPSLSHVLDLSKCKVLPATVAGTQVVIAVVTSLRVHSLSWH